MASKPSTATRSSNNGRYHPANEVKAMSKKGTITQSQADAAVRAVVIESRKK